jgi:hypothetical protein
MSIGYLKFPNDVKNWRGAGEIPWGEIRPPEVLIPSCNLWDQDPPRAIAEGRSRKVPRCEAPVTPPRRPPHPPYPDPRRRPALAAGDRSPQARYHTPDLLPPSGRLWASSSLAGGDPRRQARFWHRPGRPDDECVRASVVGSGGRRGLPQLVDFNQDLARSQQIFHPRPAPDDELFQKTIAAITTGDPDDLGRRSPTFLNLDEVAVFRDHHGFSSTSLLEDVQVLCPEEAQLFNVEGPFTKLPQPPGQSGWKLGVDPGWRGGFGSQAYAASVGWSRRRTAYCRLAAISSSSR